MSEAWFALWWPAFLTTILAETPVVALFLRDRIGLAAALAMGVALQCVTHPLFWIAWEAESEFLYAHYELAVVAFEAVIYLVEAGLIWLALPRREGEQRLAKPLLALLAATTANTISLVIGFLQAP